MLTKIELEQLKQSKSIAEILSGYGIHAEHHGRDFKILCPFHNEKTPSFNVFSGENRFKCFGCGVGGDAISLIQKLSGCDFKTAIEQLGGKITMDKGFDVKADIEADKIKKRYERGAEKLRQKKNWNVYNLLKKSMVRTPKVLKYLQKDRGWPEDFNILGLGEISYQADKQLAYMYRDDELLDAGIFRKSERFGYVHCLNNRLLIPWIDSLGRTKFIQGRDLTGKSSRKYYNVGKTPLLYCTDWQAVKGQGYAKVFEGALDAILWHCISGEHCYAIAGVSLNERKIKTILRYFRKSKILMEICFDYDKGKSGHKSDLDIGRQGQKLQGKLIKFCKDIGGFGVYVSDFTGNGCWQFKNGIGYGKDLTECWMDYRKGKDA